MLQHSPIAHLKKNIMATSLVQLRFKYTQPLSVKITMFPSLQLIALGITLFYSFANLKLNYDFCRCNSGRV